MLLLATPCWLGCTLPAGDSASDSGPGEDTDPPVVDPCEETPDDPCCATVDEHLSMCLEPDFEGPLTGTLHGWAEGGQTWLDVGEERYRLWIEGDREAFERLPDLDDQRVVVTQEADCGWAMEAAVSIRSAETGELLVLVGNIQVDDFEGWTVSVPWNTTTCEPVPDGICYELRSNQPVTVGTEGASETLMPGQSAELGEYRVRVGPAALYSGQLLCDDANGSWLNWWIAPL